MGYLSLQIWVAEPKAKSPRKYAEAKWLTHPTREKYVPLSSSSTGQNSK